MKDKVIVITGGAKGLGKELASLLKEVGASVVVADIDKEALDETVSSLGILGISADVTKESEVIDLAEKTTAQFGQIDIWINNAGVWLPRALAEDLAMDKVEKMFAVNVFGTMHGCACALRQMKKQGGGTIVNIISVSALSGRPLSSAYSASKHAIRGFTDSLQVENEARPVKILGVYPGGIKTNLFDEGRPDDFDQYMTTEMVAEKIVANFLADEPEINLIISSEQE